jgi:DHA3 family macrolide efflux protein-like MFS transporter
LVSLLGTGMTNFAVSFWIFQETGSATALTWSMFFFIAPGVILSPLAGAIVDRTNRKMMMMLSDLAAGLVTIAWLGLIAADGLQIWHIYLGNAIAGAFDAFQFPAYSAAVTLMLPKRQYVRASGMISLAGSASTIMAPALAAALLGPVGLVGIMAIDVVTFVIAIGALLIVQIPRPTARDVSDSGRDTLWQDSLFGFRYIFARRGLLGLQLVFFSMNFQSMFAFSLMVPMILARTGNDEIVLASTQSIGAIGGVVGGLLITAWGGPKRKVNGVLLGMILVCVLGQAWMGTGQDLWVWAGSAFMLNLFLPLINGSNQAIWQAKVAPEIQGRVFSVRSLIARVTAPLATALAGPLADNLFEPAMARGTTLANSFAWLVGSKPGAGMGLMFVLSGLSGVVIAMVAYLFPVIRNVESMLPDHDQLRPPVAVAETLV